MSLFLPLQAKKKISTLTHENTRAPLKTILTMNKTAALTPDGDYFCSFVVEGKYECNVYSTKDGKSAAYFNNVNFEIHCRNLCIN